MRNLFKHKNKNIGFTLIELLVCVTILGIIMALSIPVIRNITIKNTNTKYNSYLDTVVNAAKLYVDSYGTDLFGHYETGCNYVTFEELYEKNLVKDYNVDGITCNTTSTFVEVTKFEDSYAYKGFLGCTNKNDPGDLIFTLPNNGTPNQQDPATCAGIDFSSTLSISVNPSSYNLLDKKSINVKIKVSGSSGIARDSVIKYKWSTSNLDFSTDGMVNAMYEDMPTVPAQRVDISLNKVVTAESTSISTPLGESGKLYLIIYSDNLRDLYDNSWSYNDSNYMAFGPYNIDNEPPQFDVSSRVVSSNASYNNDTPKLALNVIDDLTPTSNLKMCVSYNGFCSDWENYNGSKALPKIGGFQYNGTNYPVYVSVVDISGNVSQKQFNYVSYVQCSQSSGQGNWQGSCPKCGTNVTITQTRSKKDIYLGVSCGEETREHTCNLSACCSDTKIVCGEYSAYSACSRQCATGTMKRTRECVYVSNIDGSTCGTVNDFSTLVQEVQCNNRPCAPYIGSIGTGIPSKTCDTEDQYALSRTCTLKWYRDWYEIGGSFTFSVGCNRAATSSSVLKAYRKFSYESSPSCVWEEDCFIVTVPGLLGVRYEHPSENWIGGELMIYSDYVS